MVSLYILGLAVLLQGVRSDTICCDSETGCFDDSAPYGHLPLPKCPLDLGPTFGLYTTSNRNNPQYITRSSTPNQFSSSRRTIFLVHGYLGNEDTEWLTDSKNALLDRGNYNVIIVGWGPGANEVWYPQSAANTRAIGSEIALIAGRLESRNGANGNDFWCVGHSLGAHTCGIAGMDNKVSKFGRATGLDPAGPWWEQYDRNAGINPSSADFVDIIHTDGRDLAFYYGQLRELGDYDFYPNEGHNQPGCFPTKAGLKSSALRDDSELSCSHSRAPLYWVESIKDDCFEARDKCSDPQNIPGSCSGCGNNCGFMGFAAEDTSGGRGNYYLTTTGTNPYCQN